MADSTTINNGLIAETYSPAGILANSAGDVMKNIFDVKVTFPDFLSGMNISEAEVSYRCSGFQPPQPSQETYDITWHGVKVQKVKAGIKLDRNFELTFRLGSNWVLYNAFVSWAKTMNDINTGNVGNTEPFRNQGQIALYIPFTQYNALTWNSYKNGSNTEISPDGGVAEDFLISNSLNDKNGLLAWKFYQVQCLNCQIESGWTNDDSGGSMNFKAKFIFGDVYYPFWGPFSS